MVLAGAENITNIARGRVRQYECFKALREAGQISVEGFSHPFPIKIWGPADLKNLALMHQRGTGTAQEWSCHTHRQKCERKDFLATVNDDGVLNSNCVSYRVGSGPTPHVISELDVQSSPLCTMHGDARIVEKDVWIWMQEAEMLDSRKSTERLNKLEAIIRESFGESSEWKIYRDKYPCKY
jgi:hypothetical protein